MGISWGFCVRASECMPRNAVYVNGLVSRGLLSFGHINGHLDLPLRNLAIAARNIIIVSGGKRKWS